MLNQKAHGKFPKDLPVAVSKIGSFEIAGGATEESDGVEVRAKRVNSARGHRKRQKPGRLEAFEADFDYGQAGAENHVV